MIIFGSGGDDIDLGFLKSSHCEICEKERPFHIHLSYRYRHIYYLRWVTKREYSLICDVCSRGWDLDEDIVQKSIPKDPIPFMTRNGWIFLVAGFLLLVLIANFESH